MEWEPFDGKPCTMTDNGEHKWVTEWYMTYPRRAAGIWCYHCRQIAWSWNPNWWNEGGDDVG